MRHLIAAISGAVLSLSTPLPAMAQAADPVAGFHDVVARGDVAAARQLLAKDPALASSVDRFGFQPVHLQDLYFETEMLELLLANGADINAANDIGMTLLHIIADPDAVAVLLAKGADIEARDTEGWTPLLRQVTSQENGPDVVIALVAAGADRQARSSRGQSALDLAREGGADPVLFRLLQGG